MSADLLDELIEKCESLTSEERDQLIEILQEKLDEKEAEKQELQSGNIEKEKI